MTQTGVSGVCAQLIAPQVNVIAILILAPRSRVAKNEPRGSAIPGYVHAQRLGPSKIRSLGVVGPCSTPYVPPR